MSVDFTPQINNFLSAELGEEVRGSLVDIAEAVEDAINSQLIALDPSGEDFRSGADASVLGAYMRNPTEYEVSGFQQGYYNSVTGEYHESAVYVCKLMPINNHGTCIVHSSNGNSGLTLQVIQIGANGTPLGQVTYTFLQLPKAISLLDNCYALAINISKNGGASIVPSDVSAFLIRVPEIDKKLYPVSLLGITTMQDNYFLNDFVANEIYSTTNGKLSNGAGWYRTKKPIRVKSSEAYTVSPVSSGGNAYLVVYDKDFNYLSSVALNYFVPRITPDGSYWAYIDFQGTLSENTSHTFKVIPAFNGILEYPFSSESYAIASNMWVHGDNASIDSTTDWHVVRMRIRNKKYLYTNTTLVNQFACYALDGTLLRAPSSTEYENIPVAGRLYELPAGTEWVLVNIYSNANSAQTYIKQYMVFYESDPKRVACVGDSITYIDNRDNVPTSGNTHFWGFQKYLRTHGYIVYSWGYSGYPYANTTGYAAGIADSVIAEEIDFSEIDAAILFGGSNDVRLETTLGDDNAAYATPNIDADTFSGAIGKLIKYIRTVDPENAAAKHTKIALCHILPAESQSRPYDRWKSYNAKIDLCGEFWSVPVLQTDRAVNVKPQEDAFDAFFYDDAHPNEDGSKRVGECIFVGLQELFAEG